MKEPLAEVLKQFSLGQIRDALLIVQALSSAGYRNPAALRRYYDAAMQHHREWVVTQSRELAAYAVDVEKHLPKCPDCGRPMQIVPVNTSPRTRIGGTAKSMWQCSDVLDCGHAIESDNTAAEEWQKIGLKGFNAITTSSGPTEYVQPNARTSPVRGESVGGRRRREQAAAKLTGRRRRRCAGEDLEERP